MSERENMLDFITVFSLIIGLENLQENREQSDKQQEIINAIEEHLKSQDEDYKHIIELLKERS